VSLTDRVTDPLANRLKRVVKYGLRRAGYDIIRLHPQFGEFRHTPGDVSEADARIARAAWSHTLTVEVGWSRLVALISATRHLVREQVPGAFVECGVYTGGSLMAMALTLLDERLNGRLNELPTIYGYDTFAGMSDPTDADVDVNGRPARVVSPRGILAATPNSVSALLAGTGYPMEQIRLVQGKVEDTLPPQAPDGPIALLRLDTDFYESTAHELKTLYPKLSSSGILIVDDYGYWQGARMAVDEFLATLPKPRPFLHRIDYTARLLVKP
jgi:O-methyltransferase